MGYGFFLFALTLIFIQPIGVKNAHKGVAVRPETFWPEDNPVFKKKWITL